MDSLPQLIASDLRSALNTCYNESITNATEQGNYMQTAMPITTTMDDERENAFSEAVRPTTPLNAYIPDDSLTANLIGDDGSILAKNYSVGYVGRGWTVPTKSGKRIKVPELEDSSACTDAVLDRASAPTAVVLLTGGPGEHARSYANSKLEAVLNFAGWYGLVRDRTSSVRAFVVEHSEQRHIVDEVVGVLRQACADGRAYMLYHENITMFYGLEALDAVITYDDLKFKVHSNPDDRSFYRMPRLPDLLSAAPAGTGRASNIDMDDKRKRALCQMHLLALAGCVQDRMQFAFRGGELSANAFLARFGSGHLALSSETMALLCATTEAELPILDGLVARNYDHMGGFDGDEYGDVARELEGLIAAFDRAFDLWEQIVYSTWEDAALKHRGMWSVLSNPDKRVKLWAEGERVGVETYLKAAIKHKIAVQDLIAGTGLARKHYGMLGETWL